jgi:serine/threonine protein phosphatase PrpC
MKLVKNLLRQGESASSCYIYSEVNQRPNNEDSFFTYYLPTTQQTITVLSIADGMGGLDFGEQVSRETLRKVYLALCERLIVDSSLNKLERELVNINWFAQAIEEAIKEANDFVLRMIHNNNWKRAGSTIAVAAILNNTAVVISLGDSPVFHYEKRREHLTKMTIDHTVANLQFLAGKITAEMAQYHSGRGVLKRHIGQEKLPDNLGARTCDLEEGDLLLLCTDGVSSRLSEQQIAAILAAPQDSLQGIAQRLIATAIQAGEEDNQTLILWQHCPVSSEQEEESRMTQEQLAELASRLTIVEQNQLTTSTKIAYVEDEYQDLKREQQDLKAKLVIVEEQLQTASEKLEQEEEKIEELEQQTEDANWYVEGVIQEIDGKHVISNFKDSNSDRRNAVLGQNEPESKQEEKVIAAGEEEITARQAEKAPKEEGQTEKTVAVKKRERQSRQRSE